MKFQLFTILFLITIRHFLGCKKAMDVNLTEAAPQTAAGDFTDPIMPGIFYNFKFFQNY